MVQNRRRFLGSIAATATAADICPVADPRCVSGRRVRCDRRRTSWEEVRALFELRADRIHMSGLLFASHPQPVREAIARHRDELQRDPASYISHERWTLEAKVLKSASTYLGVRRRRHRAHRQRVDGLALLYSG